MPKIKQPESKKARKKKGDRDFANTTEAQINKANSKDNR